MPGLPAAEKKKICDHITIEILELPCTDPLVVFFKNEGFKTDPIGLLNLSDDQINATEWKDDQNNKVKIGMAQASEMRILRNWVQCLKSKDGTFMLADSLNQDVDDCNDFRVGINARSFINANPPPIISASAKVLSPADQWKKGMRRDITACPILKNNDKFDEWNREFKSTAIVQGCDNPLDLTCTPTSTDEMDLCELVNQFVYSTFVVSLQTNMGKKCVREHEVDKDGRTQSSRH